MLGERGGELNGGSLVGRAARVIATHLPPAARRAVPVGGPSRTPSLPYWAQFGYAVRLDPCMSSFPTARLTPTSATLSYPARSSWR